MGCDIGINHAGFWGISSVERDFILQDNLRSLLKSSI